MKKSLGLIETQGLAAGIEAADAAVKSANVELIGYELTKGGGWTTIKVQGDVGAVKAAVDAARMAAAKVNQVVSTRVIPRPSAGLDMLVYSPDTVGYAQPTKGPDMPKPPTPPKGSKKVKEEEKLPIGQETEQKEEAQPVPEQADRTEEQEKEKAPEPEMFAENIGEEVSDSVEAQAEKEKAPEPEAAAEESKPEDSAAAEEKALAAKESQEEKMDGAETQAEKGQETGHPEEEEGEDSPEEVPEPAAHKPAKKASAAKGRKGGKRGNKQENTDKE